MGDDSQVRAFYSGKNFFITGGTGFVGLCLIEKILRTIPNVGKLFLLMRPKKGKEIIERLDEFRENPIFEKLIELKTIDIFHKLVLVAGDVGDENLGLSPEDRKTLIENVNVVIHSAATLEFQDNLRPTVKINLLGTRKVMELCKKMQSLKVMVHVSSSYVNSLLRETHEKVYEAPDDAEKIISLVETLSDEALNEIEPKVLKTHPNTYTFTKHLAEYEVTKCADLFPCTIVRPTLIVAAWKEPVPGWTCSKVGPQAFLMGASKGVVRRLPLAKENICDYIPVDVVVNQLLVAGWNAAKNKNGLSVYHCSSSTCRPFRWSIMEQTINDTLHTYPLKSAVWYPYLAFNASLWSFRLSTIFIHFFPAILLDLLLILSGEKPILFRVNCNIWNSLGRLEKFIFTEWLYDNSNTLDLCKQLNKTDSELFYIDISTLDWQKYFINFHLGVRRYLNNEKETTLPAARNKQTKLFLTHIVWQALIILLLWYILSNCVMGLTMMQSWWIVPGIYILYSFL